jgi:ribosomal-protein-alanine N-acetyltransferase
MLSFLKSQPLYTIEQAGPDDLEAIVAIERQSYMFPWSRAVLSAEITSDKEFSYVFVLRLRRESHLAPSHIIGYIIFWLVTDEIHILNVAVTPASRGQGYGKQLVRFALDFGKQRNAGRAFLEVRASNQPAQHLYQRMGFRRIGIRKQYYSDNREDAYILEKRWA